MDDKQQLSMRRRLRFSLIIVISQVLLIALAISWLVHMSIIAASGSVYFVENNAYILWTEIAITILITLFGISILIMQLRRLGERRSGERAGDRRATDGRSDDMRAGERREDRRAQV